MNKNFIIFKTCSTILCALFCIALIFTMKFEVPRDTLIDFVKITLILFDIWIVFEVWGAKWLCRILGHSIAVKPINGIVYCRRCKEPMYRIN